MGGGGSGWGGWSILIAEARRAIGGTEGYRTPWRIGQACKVR